MRAAIDTESGALVLIVDGAELDELVGIMRADDPHVINIDDRRVGAGLRPLRTVRFDRGGDAVLVTVEGEAARLAASPAGFERLAREIATFQEYNDLNQPGMHVHFEPRRTGTDLGVLAPESAPIVIAGPVPDEAAQ